MHRGYSALRPVCVLMALAALAASAQNLDEIGVTALSAVAPGVDGSGIRVAQPEAYNGDNGSTNAWEVNPTNACPSTLFAYLSGLGSSTNFPNSVGDWSSHAEAVGNYFYGSSYGVATNVAHVNNYDANSYVTLDEFVLGPITNWSCLLPGADSGDMIVNQSYIFGSVPSQIPVAAQQAIDSAYDNYATTNHTLFVSGAGNGGSVCPPSTCYNGLSVAAYNGGSSTGPTVDNGRCKPDITASSLAGLTSFSTPLVSGAAAVLMQAGLRGDGGSDTNSAADIRTVKALLLNGAIKPANWTNSNSSPLDARYGAGVLNVFNAYEQLAGGKNIFCDSNSVAVGAAHPPLTDTNLVSAMSGWDLENISSGATNGAVNHYRFNSAGGAVTVTLVWNRQLGKTNINDLDLFLLNAASSNLVACSTSRVDNVEHLFVPQLAAGRYDLQVLKNGGTNVVSDAETYALAWALVAPTLSIAKSGTNAVLTWAVYPAGFRVEATTNLLSPGWNTNQLSPPVITNSMNSLILNATNAQQFFRLRQPNF